MGALPLTNSWENEVGFIASTVEPNRAIALGMINTRTALRRTGKLIGAGDQLARHIPNNQ